MAHGRFRFERFQLDTGDRLLTRDDAPVELNARYLDALTLLVREDGRLVSKDRFLEEVWRGVPVTDEALTQCIRTIRRQLGDDAARPRFIETVPKHGYRFIAPVTHLEPDAPRLAPGDRPAAGISPHDRWRPFLRLGVAGMAGGGVAGVFGGLFYGVIGAAQPQPSGMGALSIILVLVCLTTIIGLLGGAGVGFGIATASVIPGRTALWSTVGGAVGGMFVGAVVKLVGVDAFSLLFGQTPGEITGAAEGALLGGAIGFGVWLGRRAGGPSSPGYSTAVAGLAGGAAGALIPLLGGRLMGGSLEQLARGFPNSRLGIDRMGALFGESSFGPVSQVITAGLEGALFGACVAGALRLARRRPGG
ncbi:transcriptional regulator [Brevundimonas sp.]|uniref:winged helix-turn-helix domain-containing protein n=1 Tax=Brevundimonas sp. TaxID=1871086 RepID=UPI002BC0782B|nr:transcriptional regulator [Brevundimonas sp.]HWQ85500.1 transcriptional regulator [Brevundimonas sp.]